MWLCLDRCLCFYLSWFFYPFDFFVFYVIQYGFLGKQWKVCLLGSLLLYPSHQKKGKNTDLMTCNPKSCDTDHVILLPPLPMQRGIPPNGNNQKATENIVRGSLCPQHMQWTWFIGLVPEAKSGGFGLGKFRAFLFGGLRAGSARSTRLKSTRDGSSTVCAVYEASGGHRLYWLLAIIYHLFVLLLYPSYDAGSRITTKPCSSSYQRARI